MNALTAGYTALKMDGVPDPTPVTPPGGEGFNTILNWVLGIGLVAGVLGFMIAGIIMMLQNSGRMSGGGENVAKVGWVCVGLIVLTGAPALVRALN